MRNLVALLFASYITMDQFAAANAEAAVKQVTHAADKQAVQVKDQSDSDSDDDKSNVEEASESGSDSDGEEESDDDDKETLKDVAKEAKPTSSKGE